MTIASFPLQQWYVAAFGSEVGRTPLARTVCNEPLVMFRRRDNSLAVLDDHGDSRERDVGVDAPTGRRRGMRARGEPERQQHVERAPVSEREKLRILSSRSDALLTEARHLDVGLPEVIKLLRERDALMKTEELHK